MNLDTAEVDNLLAELDPTSRMYVAEVDLGLQAKSFLQSDLGRHFVGCAHQEIADAQARLERTSPWRRHRIQELQNRIWRAKFTLAWLRDLLLSGKSAESALEEPGE